MSGPDPNWRPRANPWLIALAVTMAAFMEILDTTIVNVALPHIAGTMSASNDESTWTLTSYLVANSIVLPISGWLANVIGRKRYFLICIGAFTVCSFLCGIATSLPELVVFRLLQGFFGGGLQPNQQSIILDTFPPAQRGKAFALTAVATIVAPVLGPTLGGLITDHASWRWIFLINVPVGVATFLAVSALVEDPPWAKFAKKRKLDGIGLGLIVLGFGCMQIVMDRGEDDDWFSSPFILLFFVLAIIGIVGAIAWLTWARNPIVNLRVLADRNFALGCLMIFCMAAILYSSAVVIPQLAQTQLGYTATLAGYILSPGAILVCVAIPLVGRILPYIPTKYVIAFGFILLGGALLYSNTITPDIDFKTLVVMRMAQSMGLAFLFVPISTIAYSTLPKEQNGDAAALFTMFRNIAGSIGIAAATSMVTERVQVRMAHLVPHLTPFDQPYLDLVARNKQALLDLGHAPDEAGRTAMSMIFTTLRDQASILAYADVFLFCAAFSFCAIPLALLLTSAKKAGGEAPPAH